MEPYVSQSVACWITGRLAYTTGGQDLALTFGAARLAIPLGLAGIAGIVHGHGRRTARQRAERTARPATFWSGTGMESMERELQATAQTAAQSTRGEKGAAGLGALEVEMERKKAALWS